MAAATATILFPAGKVTVTGEADAEALWLAPAELAKTGGRELKPEGLCRGSLCVPVPPGASWVRGRGADVRAEKFYGTNFLKEAAALAGRPYYTPLDLGG